MVGPSYHFFSCEFQHMRPLILLAWRILSLLNASVWEWLCNWVSNLGQHDCQIQIIQPSGHWRDQKSIHPQRSCIFLKIFFPPSSCSAVRLSYSSPKQLTQLQTCVSLETSNVPDVDWVRFSSSLLRCTIISPNFFTRYWWVPRQIIVALSV